MFSLNGAEAHNHCFIQKRKNSTASYVKNMNQLICKFLSIDLLKSSYEKYHSVQRLFSVSVSIVFLTIPEKLLWRRKVLMGMQVLQVN